MTKLPTRRRKHAPQFVQVEIFVCGAVGAGEGALRFVDYLQSMSFNLTVFNARNSSHTAAESTKIGRETTVPSPRRAVCKASAHIWVKRRTPCRLRRHEFVKRDKWCRRPSSWKQERASERGEVQSERRGRWGNGSTNVRSRTHTHQSSVSSETAVTSPKRPDIDCINATFAKFSHLS